MNCIIIDDEPIARQGIERFVNTIPFLHLSGQYENPVEALDILNAKEVDLMFVDIQMPFLTGLELLKTLKTAPLTIITTAYSDYAIQSFELEVVDYLIKPISFERFSKAISKARELYDLRTSAGGAQRHAFFFIKCDSKYERISFGDIRYVQAMQNYVIIYTDKQRFISHLPLKTVEEYLPEKDFIKINKSQILPIARIDQISGNIIRSENEHFTIGRSSKDEILEKIFRNTLLRKGG